MRYLVTGGCGFFGSNLAREVLARQETLAVFDDLSRVGSQENLQWLQEEGSFSFYQGDIRKEDEVVLAIKTFQPDVIFHLAGQVAMTTSILDPRRDFEINALGTLNVLEAVRLHAKNAVIIYSSTNKVYGDLEHVDYREGAKRYEIPQYPHGFDEKFPIELHTPYGCSKGIADQYVLDYARMYGLATVVCRHSSIYGGRQFATVDQGWVGWFCQKAIEQKQGSCQPFTISGNGKQVRDLLHAEDAVACYFSLVENIATAQGQAFNVGGGVELSLSLLELFDLLQELLGVSCQYTSLPMRMSDQKVFIANTEKIQKLTGWKPQVGVREGVQRMVEWSQNVFSQ